MAAAEKQLESMGYHLTQERGRWPFLTPRLENDTDKTRGSAPPLIKQIWETLLVEYLLLQNRYLTGEERNPKTREELKEANGGILLLTDLCLAKRSDPLGMSWGLGEFVTCIYGPAVTYAFPDPLVVPYRYSVVHVSLISILDGTELKWCRQEELRAQMSDTVLFGKTKDPELMVFKFREQLQCRMGANVKVPSMPTPSSGT